jgi:hypothetical protein
VKYALVNGERKHAKDVSSGTIGNDLWFPKYELKAHVGRYLQYWVYTNDKPTLPPGYEPESSWHASWKELVKDCYTEIVCGDQNEHRADILVSGQVIEIQKSRIDIRDAEARVSFYRKQNPDCRVIWIINVEDSWKSKRLKRGDYVKNKKNMFTLLWSKNNRHNWMVDLARTPETHVYFEFNSNNSKLMKVWVNNGELIGSWKLKTQFFDEYLAPYSDLTSDQIHQVLGFTPEPTTTT